MALERHRNDKNRAGKALKNPAHRREILDFPGFFAARCRRPAARVYATSVQLRRFASPTLSGRKRQSRRILLSPAAGLR
jgi:hypothetical protein